MSKQARQLSKAASGMRQSVFATLQESIIRFRQSGGDLIPLHIGDTHLDPPPEAQLLTPPKDLALYGAVPGMPELREAWAARLTRRGLANAHSGANVHVGCGCTHALFCAARAVLNPGDSILVVTPYWPLIIGVLRTAGADPIGVPLTQQLYANPGLDIAQKLEQARTETTRAVYLITPNNPDGYVYTQEQIEQIAVFAKEHDLWVFADEVYSDFVYADEHESIANLEGMADRTISCYSMSKSHGMSGVRIGSIVASTSVIDAARRISNHTVYNVPVPMQQAALAALEHGDPWVSHAQGTYRDARDATCAALQEIGLPFYLPRGGSFVFINLEAHLGAAAMKPFLEAAINRGVLLAPGEAFGEDYATFLRLCYTGAPQARVLEGIHRLAQALEDFSA